MYWLVYVDFNVKRQYSDDQMEKDIDKIIESIKSYFEKVT